MKLLSVFSVLERDQRNSNGRKMEEECILFYIRGKRWEKFIFDITSDCVTETCG